MASQNTSPAWLDRPVLKDPSKLLSLENLLIVLVLVLAILSRFIMLDARTMSHDEVNHVVPSYDLYQGKGYRHDPVTHGPFQFHVVALSYFLFGDDDYTSRIPAATFSVAAIAFILFAFRRYLGRSGALIAGLLFLISPFMMYYGRYTRNEAFIELIGVVLLYGMLRYLEKGDWVGMFLVTISTVMHFIVKETAFIYTAQALIFLFFMFMLEARRAEQHHPEIYNRFLLLMSIALLLVFSALGVGIIKADGAKGTGTSAISSEQAPGPAAPEASGSLTDPSHLRLYIEIVLVAGAAGSAILGLFTLAGSLGWTRVKQMRSFSLLILIGTLILPMLSPFPVSMLGWNPLDYSNSTSMLRTGIFVALFFAIAVTIGLWWNSLVWMQNAFVFYSIFVVFYTTFFTNGNGFFTGIVGSLGYWLEQQGVERGGQPRYYYALLQMPVYEFLAYLGTFLALYFGIRYRRFSHLPGFSPATSPREAEQTPEEPAPTTGSGDPATRPADESALNAHGEQVDELLDEDEAYNELEDYPYTDIQTSEEFYSEPRPLPVLGLLIFWAVSSLLAYSLAGERMPWLTVHVALPFLLAAGWGLGYLVDTTDWKALTRLNGLLAVLLFPVFFASLSSTLGALLGTNPPFQGNTIDQLQNTNRFIIAFVASVASFGGILYLLQGWAANQVIRLATSVLMIGMAILTGRAAYRASFINYDLPTEYLVYAHGAPDPKRVMEQIEEISRRTTGGKDLQVAYSSDGLYPYWWYLRDYPNHRWYQDNPTRDLRDFPVIIAGEDVFGKIDSLLGENFYQFDYMRLWWPNQDYYNLDWDRVWGAFSNPQMREALFQIWLNRDYSQYAKATNQPSVLTLENWSPAARMRVYIRKDVVSQIWNYGASPVVPEPAAQDPYIEKTVDLDPVQVVGSAGAQPGQFNAPRGLEVARDGSLYVADSRNHRIQHLSADGIVIQTWGVFGDVSTGNAPGGTFNEPWDVAAGPDGSVYVSDTWNHRVQKFTADGQFIKTWGYFGQGEAPEAFWGPRGLAVDAQGRLYVMDTGNKRVVIFDADGTFITQFGVAGFEQGQFDEPVGIDLDTDGNVYITDTWNQRVQVFIPSNDGMFYTPYRAWDIFGWVGQSLDNKPFLAVSPTNGHVFVTDPENPRVIEFDAEGNIIRAWGEYASNASGFGLASGVAVAQDGSVWISDGANNLLLRFVMPE
jgi:uncharacterized protein (TIGR03663 family)